MTQKKLLEPWPIYSEQDEVAVLKVLRSGRVNYWTGSETKQFEKEFAEYIGSKYSVALANGSLALSAAYMSLGIEEGDEVITTPRTFIATASTIALLKAKPIFADVDKDSGLITAQSIEPLISPKTKAISVVHLGGWPAEMDLICKLAENYNIKVLEDCSQSHGSELNGKKVGTFGEVATWSFCQDKTITTAGEGGMITTNSLNIKNNIWSMKDHGKSIDEINKGSHTPGFRWLHKTFGNNFRLTEIQSVIGRNQLKKLDEWITIRQRNVNLLISILNDLSAIRIPLPGQNIKVSWYKIHGYINTENLSEDWSRDRILLEIANKGLPALSGTCSEIYLEKCFTSTGLAPSQRLPIAKKLGEESLMFLVHPSISIDQMRFYASSIREILIKASK